MRPELSMFCIKKAGTAQVGARSNFEKVKFFTYSKLHFLLNIHRLHNAKLYRKAPSKRRDYLRSLNSHSVAKYQKIEGGPFGDSKKIGEKKSHKAEITCTKNL